MHLFDPTLPRSHRPRENQEHYLHRLKTARLKEFERTEIDQLYAALDADRLDAGLPAAERVPWSAADILEWQDLKPNERFLDLKTYALAGDRITAATPDLKLAA